MTITANFALFAPELAEAFDESFERAGIAPLAIGIEHIQSALRSVKYMLGSEWQTHGIQQWTCEHGTQATSVGLVSFDLPVGAVDLVDAVLRRANNDTSMTRISRVDYLEIVDKSTQGRPDRYYVERLYDRVKVFLWRRPENTSDIIVFDYVRSMARPGKLANTLQLPSYAQEAFVSGLAARLALKWKPDRYKMLQTYYYGPDTEKVGGVLKMALDESRERVDLHISHQRSRYYGRG